MSETERLVSMPITNPDTGRPSRTFRFFGRVDAVDGGTVIDWKTVSDPAYFVQKATIGFQAECYALALQHEGVKVDCIEYRLIKKPTISFCGKDNGDPELYFERCVEWLLTTSGALTTHHVHINPARLDAARAWLWEVSKRILECRAADRWLCNENACKTWQRSCEYLPLCMAEAQGADVEWMIGARYEDAPIRYGAELQPKWNMEPLSYSSATTLCLCEKRYYWRHQRRIQPAQDEHSDALYVGSAAHVGLDTLLADGDKDTACGSAFDALRQWYEAQPPTLGEDAEHKQQQGLAQAKAIAVAVAAKWLSGSGA